MPITQARMIELISAARDYQHALREAARHVRQSLDAVTLQGASPEAELQRLAIIITESGLLTQPIEHAALILLEEKHFKQARGRNDRRARKQAAARHAAGTPAANTAPASIIPAAPQALRTHSAIREQALASAPATAIAFAGLDTSEREKIDMAVEAEIAAAAAGERFRRATAQPPAPPPDGTLEEVPGLYDPEEDDSGPLGVVSTTED